MATINLARKLLGVSPRESFSERTTRGESVATSATTSLYLEQDPTVIEYLRDLWPSRADANEYIRSLLPFIDWLPRYNRVWLYGDLVAGITVGAVVVPQGMAYARLANLPPEYGLYSSFIGVLLYFAFATSKDITIGPVAVMSLLTGHIITSVQLENPEISGPAIASTLALLCGAFVFVLGMLRLGFIVDFIPLPAIGAFMTGSALNICIGQIPGLTGISGFDTRASTYKVFLDLLQHFGRADLNAAIGLPLLFALYSARWFCNTMAKRKPQQAKAWFFASTLRTVFVICLSILISWLVNRHDKDHPKLKILGSVPRGFKHMGAPQVDHATVSAIAPYLPGAIIVLLIEHIAISKSFGRVNNYTISPSQELIAIGVANIVGPFFGAFPATGSFSRTAIKSKAGVRTPLAGVITAAVVLLALYALTTVFFWIPNAALAAVIIHAVGDLITPPAALVHWWNISPPEVIIFFAGVIGAVFGTVEIGIYTSIASTGGLLLYRIAKARGDFMGRVRVSDSGVDGLRTREREPLSPGRDVFLPLDHADGTNPRIPVEAPLPGVFIFRVRESVLYPNVNHFMDALVDQVLKETRRTNAASYGSMGERPWNMAGPLHTAAQLTDSRPTLRAVIFDFSAVDYIDVTAVQTLHDIRAQLDRHTSPDVVEFHFAGLRTPWVKRALVAGGFGRVVPRDNVQPLFTIATVADSSVFDKEKLEKATQVREDDLEASAADPVAQAAARLPVISLDRQAFHLDIPSALAFVESRFILKSYPASVASTSSTSVP